MNYIYNYWYLLHSILIITFFAFWVIAFSYELITGRNFYNDLNKKIF